MTSSRSRPAILALTQCLPYPPHSGVTNRVYHILTGLQKRFEVLLVPFVRRLHQANPEAVRSAQEELAARLFWVASPVLIPSERSKSRRLFTHFASLLSGLPYVRLEYSNGAFGAGIRSAIKTRAPSLVHAESLDLYGWFDGLPEVPLSVTHHSVESDLLRGRARVTPSKAVRAYIEVQARRLETLERTWTPRVALNLMMSQVDSDRLVGFVPSAPTFVVPNGVDVTYFSPRTSGAPIPGRLVFVGPTHLYPNRDAVEWFLAEIWPRIRKGMPGATLELVGRAREEDALRYRQVPGVTVSGHVPDVRPSIRDASLSIVPIRIGGGTRLKILDAWASGTPVLSTSTGCEGLATTDGGNIVIRNDPAAFADAALELLSNPQAAADIGRSGRSTAEAVYDWDRITGRLADRYEELLS